MTDTTKMSSRFRISIPKAVREKYNWKPGQKIHLVPSGGGLMLVPVPESGDLVGMAEAADPKDRK
jgi:AbrB family looped-hinge helix DNA binding protein